MKIGADSRTSHSPGRSSAFLFRFELRLQKERGEGDQRANENQGGPLDGPLALFHGQVEEDEKDRENDPVDHSGNSNGGVIAEDPLFVDREVEQDDERETVEK